MFQLVHELVGVGSQGITIVGEFDGDSDLVLACACSLGWGRAQQRNMVLLCQVCEGSTQQRNKWHLWPPSSPHP